jgi:hypothetical protein
MSLNRDQEKNLRERGMTIPPDDLLTFKEALEFADAIFAVFVKQFGLIDRLCKAMLKDHEIERGPWRLTKYPSPLSSRIIPLMLRATNGSCLSIVCLRQSGRPSSIRDSLPIGRSIVETIINVVYMFAEGDAEIARMDRYSMQRMWRDMHRIREVDGFRLGYIPVGMPDPAAQPELDAAIKEFTHKNGRPKKSWTDVSLEDRLHAIKRAFGLPVYLRLDGAHFTLYGRSSEIAHGTYYGNLNFLYGPPGARSELSTDIAAMSLEQCGRLMHTLIGVIEALMMAASKTLETPAYAIASKNVVREMLKIPGVTSFVSDDKGEVL